MLVSHSTYYIQKIGSGMFLSNFCEAPQETCFLLQGIVYTRVVYTIAQSILLCLD
jgi:hypothetical protein